MRIFVAVIATCVVACSIPVQAGAECKPGVERQISEVRDSWVKNWNAKELDNVVRLYAADAAFLPSDGSRASGQNEIRASLEKQIGSKVTVHSIEVDCSGEIVYDSGSYMQDLPGGGVTILGGTTISGGATIGGGGKHIEGNYLVVLKHETCKWLIVQHASTATP